MFREDLARAVRHVDGSIGCLLIGFDGIPVEKMYPDGELQDMDAVAVELTNLLDEFRRLQSDQLGDVDEAAITLGDITALAKIVDEEYLLMLVLDDSADVDRARRALRLIAPSVESEIR
ncbi:MAG: hypothetical protein ABEL76_05365 [Bradymonadaceae bacterium]